MCDQDHGALLPRLQFLFAGCQLVAAQQYFDHALNNLHHILFTLAQIGIFNGVKLGNNIVHLLLERPFGIAQLIADNRLGCLGE